MNTPSEIAIIGAGIAGLACARRLQLAGVSVTLIDKSRGPGGRMSTRRGEQWQCDHGAQYFTARHPQFRAEVERWLKAGVAARWQPRLTVFGSELEHELDPALERFVGVPRMTSPARWLADDLDLISQATVRLIAPLNGGWKITSHEHGEHSPLYKSVVIAVPAPQAEPLLRPRAPMLADVALQANMLGCWAMMLNYPAPLDLPFDAAFVNTGPLRWVSCNSSKPGRTGMDTWLLHASAEWSEAHLDDKPEDVARELLEAFTALGGSLPATWTVHRWRYANTAPPLQHGSVWDTALGLGLCGDWLNGGKVEGAWLSGHALAEQILLTLDQRRFGH